MKTKRYRIRFNKGRQTVLFEVGGNIKAFRRKHKCDAQYWCSHEGRKKRRGLFGFIQLPSRRGMTRGQYAELISHEVYHLVDDWWRCRRGNHMNDNNEELRATIHGEIVRKITDALL